MKTKHLLMACALPALFAACSQEEALVNVEPEIQYKGKLAIQRLIHFLHKLLPSRQL